MKKLIALILASALMLCAFTGCGATSATTASTAATTDTAAATDAAAATDTSAATDTAAASNFKWNGQKEVWSILPTTGAEGLVMINDAMGAVMEAQGFTYVKKDANGDPSAQVQYVEDAIAAGNVGALMIAAMSVDMLQDVVQQALDKGIAVAMLGAEPTNYGVSGCVYTAYEITGMYAVEAAQDWIANSGASVPTNADGKYEVACDVYTDIQDGVYRSNAIVGTVDNSDNLVRVSTTSSYGQSAFSDAYNNAQDTLNAHPDCHVFISYEPEEAMGAASAISDYCNINNLKLSDYCVIPCYAEDDSFKALYDGAVADPNSTAIKGYATYGDSALPYGDDTAAKLGASYDALSAFAQSYSTDVIIAPLLTGEHLADILLSACGTAGYDFTYGETYYDTITATNVCGFSATWSMGDENPASQYKTAQYIGG